MMGYGWLLCARAIVETGLLSAALRNTTHSFPRAQFLKQCFGRPNYRFVQACHNVTEWDRYD